MPRGASAFTPARLRDARHQNGLSLHDVAQQTGLTLWHVAKIESGHHRPSVGLIAQLAQTVGIDVDDLLSVDGTFAYLRARVGKTQAGVAADLGISPAAIGRIETGVRTGLPEQLTDQLAASLQCSAEAVRRAHQIARRTA